MSRSFNGGKPPLLSLRRARSRGGYRAENWFLLSHPIAAGRLGSPRAGAPRVISRRARATHSRRQMSRAVFRVTLFRPRSRHSSRPEWRVPETRETTTTRARSKKIITAITSFFFFFYNDFVAAIIIFSHAPSSSHTTFGIYFKFSKFARIRFSYRHRGFFSLFFPRIIPILVLSKFRYPVTVPACTCFDYGYIFHKLYNRIAALP